MNALKMKKIHYVILVVILVFLFILSYFYSQGYKEHTKQESSLILETYQKNIQLNLQHYFNYTDELVTAIDVGDDMTGFEETVQKVMKNPICEYVAYVDGMILKEFYSKDIKDPDKGTDISKLNYAYTLARLTKNYTVEGPITQDGKDYFLTIQPMFKKQNDKEVYIGEVAIALKKDEVIKAFELNQLKEYGYDYELWSIHPLDGSKQTISYSSSDVDFSKAIEAKVKLPTVWTLSLIPEDGWDNNTQMITLFGGSIFIVALIGIAFWLYRDRNKLQNEILNKNRFDNETQFYVYHSFKEEIQQWIDKPDELFGLIYIDLYNYSYIYQHSSLKQKEQMLEIIVKTLNDFVKAPHLIGRLSESIFLLAIKDDLSQNEFVNMKKGLSIEMIQKITIENEKLFLDARCHLAIFLQDGNDLETLIKHCQNDNNL